MSDDMGDPIGERAVSKPKLSEIRARTKRACEKGQYHYFPAASHALFHDIPDLLGLVERLGAWITKSSTENCACLFCQEARALFKELEL